MMSSEKWCSNCSNISHESGNICNVGSFQDAEKVSNDTFTRNVSPTLISGDTYTRTFEKMQSTDATSMIQESENLSSDNKDDDQTDEIQEAEQSQSIQRDVIVNHKRDAEKDQEKNEIQKETKQQEDNICGSSAEEYEESFKDISKDDTDNGAQSKNGSIDKDRNEHEEPEKEKKQPEDNICCSSTEEYEESFKDISKDDTDNGAQSKNGSIDKDRNKHEEPEKEKKQPGFHNEMKEIRLIMIGPTGSGKSKTGNTILGKDHFESKMGAVSVTSKCKLGKDVRFNRKVVVIDTPGVFDTRKDNQHTAEEIMKCIAMTTPGPHAFLLVLNPTVPFTSENKESVEFFVKHFGKNLFDYLIVVFTRKDQLEQNNTTIEEILKDIPEELESLLDKCGNKYFVINNMANDKEKETQISDIFQMIDRMIQDNNDQHYTIVKRQINTSMRQGLTLGAVAGVLVAGFILLRL